MTKHAAPSLAEALRGKFVVFDGPDGAGKSTQRQLLADFLQREGVSTQSCRDPGGTVIGDRIRSVLLDFDLSQMDVNCEAMLFMASRAQLVAEVIRPALASGKTVLCDRFVSSTCAYQGAAGYDPKRVIALAKFAFDNFWPHITVILDVDASEGMERIGRKPKHAGKHRQKKGGGAALIEGSVPDAMEARPLEFHRRVRELFREIGTYFPSPVVLVDGQATPPEVHIRVCEAIHRVLR